LLNKQSPSRRKDCKGIRQNSGVTSEEIVALLAEKRVFRGGDLNERGRKTDVELRQSKDRFESSSFSRLLLFFIFFFILESNLHAFSSTTAVKELIPPNITRLFNKN